MESHRTQSRLGLSVVRMEGQKPLTREAAEAYASIGIPVVAWQDDLGATHYRLLPEHERQRDKAPRKAHQASKDAPQSTIAPKPESKPKPFAPTAAEAAEKQAIKRLAARNGIFNLWTGH